jgi:hypothetical protein
MRHTGTRAFVVLCLILAVACGGETRERGYMKQMAGTYAWDDSLAGAVLTRTLKLDSEGNATFTQELTLRGREPQTSASSGTYSAGEGTLTTRFANVPLTYTILGDTLFPRLGPRDRYIESMTGRKGGTNMGDERLVRVR